MTVLAAAALGGVMCVLFRATVRADDRRTGRVR
jgi:hypothetical protein